MAINGHTLAKTVMMETQYDRKKEPPKPVFSVQADTMSQSFGTKAEAEAYKAQLLKDYPNADMPIVEKNITANPKFEGTPDFVNRTHFEQPNILAHMRVDDRVIDGKKKPSKFMITLNNVEYAFGEDILMQVDCDNTESSVGVKAIKFKLYLCYQQRQEDSSLT